MLLFGRPACGLIHYVTLQKPMSSCVDKEDQDISDTCNCDSGGWRCRFLLHVGEVLLISLGKSETCAVANVYAPKSIAEKYSSSLSYSPSSLSAPSILILLIRGHSSCSLPLWIPSHPCLLLCTNARRPSSETWPWTAHSLDWTDSTATQCLIVQFHTFLTSWLRLSSYLGDKTAAPGRKWTYKHREWWIAGHAWIAVQQCVHKSTWIASCLVSNECWQQFQAFAFLSQTLKFEVVGKSTPQRKVSFCSAYWAPVLHFIGTHVSHRTRQTLSGSAHDKDLQHTSCSWCPISVESALALIMLSIAGILWCQCCEPNDEDMESLEWDQVDCKLAGGQSSLAQGNWDSKSHHS